MPQKCTSCKNIIDKSEFNWLQINKEAGLAKSCRDRNFEKYLWITKDRSKITDPWKIVADHKFHVCAKFRKEKVMEEYVACDSKYKSK